MKHYIRALVFVGVLGLAPISPGNAQSAQITATAARSSFTYEFYYKIKWGHFDEFLELYKKNHWPILRKQKERGEILSLSADFPINHMGEDTRWDFRMTVTYRDAIAAHVDPSEEAWVKAMYPDQPKFKAEELRRFELLLEHLDLPVSSEDPEGW